MYNKFIFINNNRRKKQKELEAQKVEENSQISFDMLASAQMKIIMLMFQQSQRAMLYSKLVE